MFRCRCWRTCICICGPTWPPSKATIWHVVVTDADAEVFDVTVGSWLMTILFAELAGQGEAADITKASQWASRFMDRPFAILGFT